MSERRRVTEKDHVDIRQLKDQNVSIADIAAIVGRTENTVRYSLRGQKPRRVKALRDAAVREEARTLSAAGVSRKVVAARVGVSIEVLRRLLPPEHRHRQRHNTVVMHLKVSPDLDRRISAAAASFGTSKPQFIRSLMESHLAKEDQAGEGRSGVPATLAAG